MCVYVYLWVAISVHAVTQSRLVAVVVGLFGDGARLVRQHKVGVVDALGIDPFGSKYAEKNAERVWRTMKKASSV